MRKGHSLWVLLIAVFLVIFVPSIQAAPSPSYGWHTFYWASNVSQLCAIATDGSGNIFITGESVGTWNGPAGQSPLHPHSEISDFFVLKLDSSGAYQWHTFYGSSNGGDTSSSIATDGSGNVYVSGVSNATWNGPVGQSPLHANSGLDIFVLKLNSSGSYQWHTFYGSSDYDGGYAIATDGSANVYLTGYSGDTWNGPDERSPLHAHSGVFDDIFVLKLNSSGAYQWHTFYGSGSYDQGKAIAANGSGNVYITGESNATWNGPAGQSPINAHSGLNDIVVLKLDSSGAYQWHTFHGSNGSDSGSGITTDGSGNLYITGESNATWNGPAGQSPLHANSGDYYEDIFVLKLDSNGAYQWHTFYGTSDSDQGYGIVTDGSGNAYVTGSSTATWNGAAGENPLHAHSGTWDMFVLKLDTGGAYQWHTFYGSGINDYGYSIAGDGSGNFYVTGCSLETWDGPAGQSPLHAHSGLGYSNIFVLTLAAPAPDLIETAVSNPPTDSMSGSSFSVTDTVKNQGGASAEASITSYYLSLDATRGSGDIHLTGSRSVPSLGINETNEGILTVTIPLSTTSGSYYLLACADDTNVVEESDDNNNCIASVSKINVTPLLTLQSPVDGTVFDPCSLVATHQPTFNWTAFGAFSGLSVQFSTSPTDFKTFGVLLSKVALRATSVSWTPTFFSWKNILTASYNKGNVRDIYWKLVGTLADRTIVESEVRSFRIGPPQTVTINAPAEGVTLPFNPPPSFNINANCNVKFTLQFSSSDAFLDPKILKGFIFTLKDPTLQPTFQKTLTSWEWMSVKKLLAPRGYFRVKASDTIGRETISEVRSFNIQSMLIGNWNVTGMVTTTVMLVGYIPVTRRAATTDAFTFSENGSFQMTDMSGTYTEQGTTFAVNLSPAAVELYFEQALGAALGVPVDITVTEVSFGGTENWTLGTINGTITMLMGISVPSQGLQGSVKATVTFRGVRSPVQGLSLSPLEASSSQPSQSLIRVIGADTNKSIQGIKGGGQ